MRTAVCLLLVLSCFGCRSTANLPVAMQPVEPAPPQKIKLVSHEQEEQAAQQTLAYSIDELVQIGLSQNPLIAEARDRAEAARHRAPQEWSLPDPTLNTTTYLSPVETAAGRQTFALGINQKVTDYQRRTTKAAIATEEARAAAEELRLAQLELAERIRNACYQLLFVRRSIEITAEDMVSLERLQEVVIRAHEVDRSVTQQDVLNVQIEQSNVENQLTDLRRQEQTHRARLARLLHMPSISEVTILDDLTITSTSLDLEELTSKALAARPELGAQLARMRSDHKKVCLANLQHKPDVTVGLNWIATSSDGLSPVANGDDAILLGVGFNLPVYRDRIRAAICEARANSRASDRRFAVIQDQITEEVFSLIVRAESLAETLSLLEGDIIPKANRSYELAIEEYSSGELEYVQLIENWRNLLRYRISAARLVSDYNQVASSLARASGDADIISQGLISPAEGE